MIGTGDSFSGKILGLSLPDICSFSGTLRTPSFPPAPLNSSTSPEQHPSPIIPPLLPSAKTSSAKTSSAKAALPPYASRLRTIPFCKLPPSAENCHSAAYSRSVEKAKTLHRGSQIHKGLSIALVTATSNPEN
jgi:hypothetical protein